MRVGRATAVAAGLGLVVLWTGVVPPPSLADDKAQEPVRVKTAEEAARSSQFLRPTGPDAYDQIDWTTVPPWQQTSFFGVRARGKTFIYVVDCSGSMADDGRLIRAKSELRRSILRLQFPQRFQVIFYNDRPLTMPGGVTLSADAPGKSSLVHWLRRIDADGETDPRGAMAQALALRPDAVFLLSDGEFPKGTVEAIARSNQRKVPIHCIDLAGGAAGGQLRQIAAESGGQYRPQ